MAPKVIVPMDFGRDLLKSPTHNNLKLNTNEGGEVLASSVILSFNSPVIDHVTTTLHMTSVDLLEFGEAGVQLFVDCAYSGTAEGITAGLFRDVNKIANVLEVAWLIGECSKYFNGVADSMKTANYSELLFLFEEAAFVFENLKKREFLEVAMKQIEKFSWKQKFIDSYLNNADRLSTKKLDLVIELAGQEVEFVVQKLTQQLSDLVLERGLPNYCRYLLDNSDLSLCKQFSPAVFDSLFGVLDILPENELRWTYGLLRKSVIKSSTNPGTVSEGTAECAKSELSKLDSSKNGSQTPSDAETSQQQSNFIKLFKPLFRPRLPCLDDLFKWLHESENATNIMVALDVVSNWNVHCVAVYRTETCANEESLKIYYLRHPLKVKLEDLRRRRGWLRLPSTLKGYKIRINGYAEFDISFLCTLNSTGYELATTPIGDKHRFTLATFEFNFRHPSVTSCNLEGHCGFILKYYFWSENEFTLCTKKADYTRYLHFHQKIKAEDIIHVFLKSSEYIESYPWKGSMPTKKNRQLAVLFRI